MQNNTFINVVMTDDSDVSPDVGQMKYSDRPWHHSARGSVALY